MRMYRIVFELIRKNASRERQIDDVSDSGKWDMRALFQKSCRNKIQIKIRDSVREMVYLNIGLL